MYFKSETDEAPERVKRASTISFPSLSDVLKKVVLFQVPRLCDSGTLNRLFSCLSGEVKLTFFLFISLSFSDISTPVFFHIKFLTFTDILAGFAFNNRVLKKKYSIVEFLSYAMDRNAQLFLAPLTVKLNYSACNFSQPPGDTDTSTTTRHRLATIQKIKT